MPNQHPKQVKTVQELSAGITPMLPGQPERIPWTWFDTQNYVTGATTVLEFFQNVNADKNLSNMVAAGQIPSPMFFDLYNCSISYLIPVSVGAPADPAVVTGAVNDVDRLSQGACSLVIANKDYWQGSQMNLPCGGGVGANVAYGVTGTAASGFGATAQFATNGNPDLRNRYNFWGDITIPHNQNFTWKLTWSAALVLAPAVNRQIRLWMDGYLYRRVL